MEIYQKLYKKNLANTLLSGFYKRKITAGQVSMMELRKLPFFEIEYTLSTEDRSDLLLFAQLSFIKTGKKAVQLLSLLNQVPKSNQAPDRRYKWLKKKLLPNDPPNDNRNLKRIVKQAETIYWQFFAIREMNSQPAIFLPVIMEALLNTYSDEAFLDKLKELEFLLGQSRPKNAWYFLDSYRKDSLIRKLLTKQRKLTELASEFALSNLNRFYLLEKLKYAISISQLAKIQSEELPHAVSEEIAFLVQHQQYLISQTPVLKMYWMAYQLISKEEKNTTAGEWLTLLELHSKDLLEEESRELYTLVANFLIQKINTSNLSLSQLKTAYQEYFRFNQLLRKEGLLLEGGYIPQGRFQNVISSALNTGEPEDILWAKDFLRENLQFVRPEEREDLKGFCLGAIHFYDKKYEDCLKALSSVHNVNRFYYCDIKSLELRTFYECDLKYRDLDQYIGNTLRAINEDETLSDQHKKGYLDFFKFCKQLFRLKTPGKFRKDKIAALKKHISETTPLAQKKWLLEKIDELEMKF